MKVQKIELKQSLKAEDYESDSVVIETAYIISVEAVKTKFNEDGETSTLMTLRDDSEEGEKAVKSMFVNMTSLNNCIDAFGDETTVWTGKAIKVVCNKDNFYKKKQLVIEPIN